jgi:hypothetical protein
MTDTPHHGTGWSRWVRGTRGALSVWDRVVVLGYLLLVAFGITTSSVGSAPLLDNPAARPPGLVIGGPDSIRSDEFLRSTPWVSGILKAGGPTFSTPLGYKDSALVATPLGGPFTTLMYPDTRLVVTAGKWLPTQAFAGGWWLFVLAVALLAPRWFRRFGVGPEISLPLTVVLLVSPACVWWSWSPVAILGWAFAAAVSAGYAVDDTRRRGRPSWRGWLFVLVAGVCLGRLALTYQPWSIPLGAAILVPTAVGLVYGRDRLWWRLGQLGLALVVAGLSLMSYFREHANTLTVLSNTAYPGARRFAGDLVDPSVLLAGPHLWVSQTTPPLVNTNLSEAATGYTILGVIALLLVPAVRWRRLDKRIAVPVAASGITLMALASWCLFAWPAPASHLFPMSLVSPGRLAQVIGLAATLTFGVFLAAWRTTGAAQRFGSAVLVGVMTFFLTAVGGSAFRSAHLPSYRAVYVIGISLITAVALAVVVLTIRRWWALAPVAVLAVCVTATVSPWQIGFADLRNGHAARSIDALASSSTVGPHRWASDDIFTDALFMANAVPSVSGEQWAGPHRRAWEVLDPDDSEEETWNRGASYINFAWGRPGSAPVVTLQATDVIVVTVDPCGTALDRLGVDFLVSRTPLSGSCLDERRSFDFGGSHRYVYSRAG